jgi:hypothetical protein
LVLGFQLAFAGVIGFVGKLGKCVFWTPDGPGPAAVAAFGATGRTPLWDC